MDKDIQREIRKIINEIEDKSGDGDYIYRGEPKTHEEHPHYGKVSSSLWRDFVLEIEGFDIEAIQTEMLAGAKKHTGHLPQDVRPEFAAYPYVIHIDDDDSTDFEILTQIQHFGGNTNLIDFTTNYFIALFFACDGYHKKDGRVILQKTEDIHNMIKYPRNPRHRVIVQKSVFVRPPKGFIEPRKEDIISIPGPLKQWILQSLRKYHGISTETIYNDLYGYIRNQGIHGDAYTRFYKGYASQNRWTDATSSEERQKENEKSIEYYTEAIKLRPNFLEAFFNRAGVYINMGKYNHAIKDLTAAIDLNHSHVDSYSYRAFCRGMRGDYEHALADCNRAIELDNNNSDAYGIRGIVYERMGDYEPALLDCNRAIELNNNNSVAYNARGVIYYKKGDYTRAIADYTKALQLNSNFAEAYVNRGLAWLHLREWDKARSDLKDAKNITMDIIDSFQEDYGSVVDFQQKTGVTLPEDIAQILTSP